MAKKQKPNGYSLFVGETFKRLTKEGKSPNYNGLFSELSQEWSNLADSVKQKYKDRAKQGGEFNDRPLPGSSSNPASAPLLALPSSEMASNGAAAAAAAAHAEDSKVKPTDVKPSISEMVDSKESLKRPHDEIDWFDEEDEKDEELAAENEKKIKLGLPNHWRARQEVPERYGDKHLLKLRESCNTIVAARERKLVSMPIYFISVNILCYKKINGVDVYVPIEIGILAYSLKAGKLCEPYHVLIDAGRPPDGCINLAADHAESTHKISIPPKEPYPSQARKDYKQIYKEMVKFVESGERTVLAWNALEMKQIVGSLEWLYEKANSDNVQSRLPRVSTWTILPVVEFAASMCNFVHMNMLGNRDPIFAIHYYINMLLDKSEHDYRKDLMCAYHKQVESRWCARSCAIRMLMNIERIFEAVFHNYMTATSPQFILAQATPTPQILYHEQQPSPMFHSIQTQAAAAAITES